MTTYLAFCPFCMHMIIRESDESTLQSRLFGYSVLQEKKNTPEKMLPQKESKTPEKMLPQKESKTPGKTLPQKESKIPEKTRSLKDTLSIESNGHGGKPLTVEMLRGENCPVCGRSPGDAKSSPHLLPPGTILNDRYLIGCAQAEGGYGILYIGFDMVLQLRVAVKEYFPVERCTRLAQAALAVSVFPGVQEHIFMRGKRKFLVEARILAKMEKQDVIVDVRDYFEDNNTAYIVMEYIDGMSFREYIEQYGRGIGQDELFTVVRPLFDALSELHREGLIHRDICPDNLMLEPSSFPDFPSQSGRSSSALRVKPDGCDDEGRKAADMQSAWDSHALLNGKVRLLDFGSARETHALKSTLSITLRHGYAPIEQYQEGGGQGPWTDIYSLCAVFYYCLTGLTPPLSTNRIIEDTLKPPSALGVEISPARESALMKGLRVRPHSRWHTVEDLKRALYES